MPGALGAIAALIATGFAVTLAIARMAGCCAWLDPYA
jgi:hypothetical protein